MALMFLLGALIATAATAGAASLITGKQIKDGSIGSKDLSKAIRAQLARAGVPGPQGPKGETGSPGGAGPQGAAGPQAIPFSGIASAAASPGTRTLLTSFPDGEVALVCTAGPSNSVDAALRIKSVGVPAQLTWTRVASIGTQLVQGGVLLQSGDESGPSLTDGTAIGEVLLSNARRVVTLSYRIDSPTTSSCTATGTIVNAPKG